MKPPFRRPIRPGRRPESRAFRPPVEALERRLTMSTFVVSNTLDAGPGSLREAISRANASIGPDRIDFAIPTTDPNFHQDAEGSRLDPDGFWSIAPRSALPAITESVIVDGWSQARTGHRSRPPIVLDGGGAGDASNGMVLADHSGSTVRGLSIAMFRGDGVSIRRGGGHSLSGNFIGTDATGRLDRGNAGAGVSITDSRSNVVGGDRPGERNVISGNDTQGLNIGGPDSVGNRVVGNLIGTTISGDQALGNGSEEVVGDGVRIDGGRDNVIGGREPAERNVISGNFDDGVDLHDGSTGNRVLGNFIGTDITGTRPLGNGIDGVFLQNASHNIIGGLGRRDANVIGANGFNGLFLFGDSAGNLISGNFIGTNPGLDEGLGNNVVADFADGIFLAQLDTPKGPSGNVILGNTLAHNLGTGLSIDVDPSGNSTGNLIARNAIFGNGEQAIDLASDGVTPNDDGDRDLGPNRSQNAPELREPVGIADGTYRATGTLKSTPLTLFRVEFFAGAHAGDAEVYLGSRTVVADADGQVVPFSFDYRSVPGKPHLAATATDLRTGDTSELSAPVSPPRRPSSAGIAPATGARAIDDRTPSPDFAPLPPGVEPEASTTTDAGHGPIAGRRKLPRQARS